MDPKDYIELFRNQQQPHPSAAPSSSPIKGICTRIIRIGNPSHRTKLSGDDPNRRIVFVSNAKSSADLLGLTGFECLLRIGYPEDWIRGTLLPPGPDHRDFEMVAFPGLSCVSATWVGFLGVVADAYPEVKEDCDKHLETLSKMATDSQDKGWDHYNKTLGCDIAKIKKGDPKFMDLDTYLGTPRDVAHFRAFLAHSCYANKLFSGDGWTHDGHGQRQGEEFVMVDAVIADIPGVARCDMEVVAPPSSL